jgi:hypothetical protein
VVVARRLAGAVLLLTGAVWIGQGTNLIQGSSMTGSAFWAVVGALCVVAGLFLLGWPWRQSRADPGDSGAVAASRTERESGRVNRRR